LFLSIDRFTSIDGPSRWHQKDRCPARAEEFLSRPVGRAAAIDRALRQDDRHIDRYDRIRLASRVSAHHGPGEATLTPVILVRIQVPQPTRHPPYRRPRPGSQAGLLSSSLTPHGYEATAGNRPPRRAARRWWTLSAISPTAGTSCSTLSSAPARPCWPPREPADAAAASSL